MTNAAIRPTVATRGDQRRSQLTRHRCSRVSRVTTSPARVVSALPINVRHLPIDPVDLQRGAGTLGDRHRHDWSGHCCRHRAGHYGSRPPESRRSQAKASVRHSKASSSWRTPSARISRATSLVHERRIIWVPHSLTANRDTTPTDERTARRAAILAASLLRATAHPQGHTAMKHTSQVFMALTAPTLKREH